MQKGRSLDYFSKALGKRSAALSTYDKEAIAILESLKRWRHCFLGNHLTIKTDQKSLEYIIEQRVSKGIQHKLMLKLLEFNYTIEYKKGKEYRVTNALSRREHCLAISMALPAWIEEIENSYKEDQHCKEKLEQLIIAGNSVPPYSHMM